MKRDLPPFRGAIDQQDYISDISRFQGSAGDARFLDKRFNLEQAEEIKPSADPPELTDFAGQRLLTFDPVSVAGWRQRINPFLPQGRSSVSPQKMPHPVEFQHVRGIVNEVIPHGFMVQE